MKPKSSTTAAKKISLKQATLLAKHLKNQPMTRKTNFKFPAKPPVMKPGTYRPTAIDPDGDGDDDRNDPKDLKG